MTLRGVVKALCRGMPPALLCGVLASAAAPAMAADELRYSLGTIQSETILRIPPGGWTDVTLGFYNIDGNVPTMVDLSVTEAPPWCAVALIRAAAPGADEVTLLVEPSAPQAAMPQCAEEGRQAFLVEPRGYVCADVVGVRVEVDDCTDTDDVGAVRVVALARWESGGGITLAPQERKFLFDVVVDAGDGTVAVQPSRLNARARLVLMAAVVLMCAALLYRLLVKSGVLA